MAEPIVSMTNKTGAEGAEFEDTASENAGRHFREALEDNTPGKQAIQNRLDPRTNLVSRESLVNGMKKELAHARETLHSANATDADQVHAATLRAYTNINASPQSLQLAYEADRKLNKANFPSRLAFRERQAYRKNNPAGPTEQAVRRAFDQTKNTPNAKLMATVLEKHPETLASARSHGAEGDYLRYLIESRESPPGAPSSSTSVRAQFKDLDNIPSVEPALAPNDWTKLPNETKGQVAELLAGQTNRIEARESTNKMAALDRSTEAVMNANPRVRDLRAGLQHHPEQSDRARAAEAHHYSVPAVQAIRENEPAYLDRHFQAAMKSALYPDDPRKAIPFRTLIRDLRPEPHVHKQIRDLASRTQLEKVIKTTKPGQYEDLADHLLTISREFDLTPDETSALRQKAAYALIYQHGANGPAAGAAAGIDSSSSQQRELNLAAARRTVDRIPAATVVSGDFRLHESMNRLIKDNGLDQDAKAREQLAQALQARHSAL